MKLTLYHGPRHCSMVTLIALYEAGADFEIRPVNLRKEQTRTADYLSMNPKGKVPVLVIDGEPLTENVAILTWIARTFPEKKLLPADPIAAIKALSLMAWCASGLQPIMPRINHSQRYCDVPGSADSVHRLALQEFTRQMKIADDILAGRHWVFDHFTLVDGYLWWVWHRATMPRINLDPRLLPHYAAHAGRMMERSSVQRVLAHALELEAQFAKAA